MYLHTDRIAQVLNSILASRYTANYTVKLKNNRFENIFGHQF